VFKKYGIKKSMAKLAKANIIDCLKTNFDDTYAAGGRGTA